MTKTQAAALLLIGSAVGVTGKAGLEAALSPAQAARPTTFTHAVDLRRDYSADAGSPLRFLVYATERKADGGTKDISQARTCKPSTATTDGARALMNVLAGECSWD